MWCYSYFKDTPQAPPLVGPQWEMENLCLSLWHLDLHLNPDKGLAIKHSLYTKNRGRLYRRGSCCGAKHLAGLSFNAHCRDVSVFNVKVINNAKGRARPVAVKGQGGVGKTKYIFFLPFLLHGSSFRAGCVINCTGQWGIYVKVQMEVTSDLSCGVSQLSNCQTLDCSDNEPQLFVPHFFLSDVIS